MKIHFLFIFFFLIHIIACQQESTQKTVDKQTVNNPANSEPAANTNNESVPLANPINPETDFILEYNVGIINGTQAPDSVKVSGNGRYFDYGIVEVKTQGTASLSGEVIQYRPKGIDEWIFVSENDPLFFLGFDGQRHLIIDKGSTTINRNVRLFDIQNGAIPYRSKYNNMMVKEGALYLLRFADPDKLSNLPVCDTAATRVLGYEEVIAVSLNNYHEAKTGQVFCVYK